MKEGNTSVKKLRQSIEKHSSGLTALKVDPTLWSSPRWTSLPGTGPAHRISTI